MGNLGESSNLAISIVNNDREIEEKLNGSSNDGDHCMLDGSVDDYGRPARRDQTGRWLSGVLLLVNLALTTVAYVAVEVNLIFFSTRVLRQSNAQAVNTYSRWRGMANLFSLVGAFLSDAYLGSYLTCIIFQVVLIIGLVMLSLTTSLMLLKPYGCGSLGSPCDPHSQFEMAMFYLSIYLFALGNGACEPALATFGENQFDEENPREKASRKSFYVYFYVASNLGELFAETVLAYLQNLGHWVPAFWVSASCGVIAYIMLLMGHKRYRHVKSCGNPLVRFSQVVVAAWKKSKVDIPWKADQLFEVREEGDAAYGGRRILHTKGFRFFDHAAVVTPTEATARVTLISKRNPWQLCTVTQVEEMKCILRILPIWLCTIFFSVVIVQMASLFNVQGAAMNTNFHGFQIPPASLRIFDIISIAALILLFKVIVPFCAKITKTTPKPPSHMKKMGIGLVIAFTGTITAGIIEQHRLKHARVGENELSSLSILWQVPQYILLGVTEAFVYIGQLDFFSSQTPDTLKSIGIGLSMFSSFLGSYMCSFVVSIVMKMTTKGGKPGWIPANLNDGRLDKFFFLMAGFTVVVFFAYVWCAKRYKCISLDSRKPDGEAEEEILA